MRVVTCPDFRDTNPYQKLLATAVSHQNITVLWGGYGRFALLKALKQKPDLIHLHWIAPFWLDRNPLRSRLSALRFLAEVQLVKRRGIKLVWTIHNLQDHERTNPCLEHAVNRQLCRLVDRVIVHCAAAEATVLQTYRLSAAFHRKIAIIQHGNFIGVYENKISQTTVRKRLHLPLNATVFLYFGQIRPYKGVPSLIRAFRQIGIDDAHLLIVGQPANAAMAASLHDVCGNHPRVHLHLKFIPDAEIQQFMNAADIVVLPFRDISTSSTVILGMSFGKAIITPSIGCLPETLDVQGCHFYDPTANELAQTLQQMVGIDWRRMGEHNLEMARRMNWNDIGRQTAELYQRI